MAFVGGADVAAAQFTGHIESLLAVQFPGVRFRNLAWEGDTVFAQPREINFPPLTNHLQRAGATVVVLQFGRTEALGQQSVPNFARAYERLLDSIAHPSRRLALVTPPPFERGPDPLPDLSVRNGNLAAHAEAIRALARKHGCALIDLFAELQGRDSVRLTEDGQQLSPRGHALVAQAFARRIDSNQLSLPAEPLANGVWPDAEWEKLRRAVIAKNQHWFNYYRPHNWAFLGGDRTSQPSSRDHRDLKVRWFPAEMEKFLPLIAEKEKEMETLAAEIRGDR